MTSTHNTQALADLLHDTGCHEHGQGYRRQQVLTVTAPMVGVNNKVRLTFERENRDEGSRYYAEVWTDRGWAEVVRIVGTDPRVTESAGMPSYVCIRFDAASSARQTVADCEEWSSRILAALLAETLDIIA